MLEATLLVGAAVAAFVLSRRRRGCSIAWHAALAAIVESSADAIVITDVDGMMTSWNPAAERFFGWRAEEAVGRRVEAIVTPPERDRVASALERLRRDREAWQSDIGGLRRDGVVVELALAVFPVLESGDLVGMAIIATDVTERNRTEAALRQREHQLAEAERLARLGSWSWDVRRNSSEWSDEFFCIFGLVPDDRTPSYARFLAAVQPEHRELVESTFRRCLEGSEHYDVKFRVVRPDGIQRWVHARGAVEHDGAGHPLRMAGTVQDITEALGTTRELAVRKDALDARRAKSQFLSTVSHELRTPLNAVIGFTELLVRSTLEDHQRELANGVLAAAETLLTLINDVLVFCEIDSGPIRLDMGNIDVEDLLEEIRRMVDPQARSRGLEVVVSCDRDLALRRADRARLRQVLVKLASNAVKFTERGEVAMRAIRDVGETVRFEVADTGIGIAPEDAERLFDPFVQADSSTTRRYSGTGLGLAICRRLVEAMGGRIDVESVPGVGSTFSFTIPLPPADD